MHLREQVRRPGRYREDNVEDLPPNPRFVIPDVPFNPNLRPAVFPTLRHDELPPDHPIEIAKREERERRATPERSESPALVFRDNRVVPAMEEEWGLRQRPDGRWVASEEPGEFQGFDIFMSGDEGGEQQERWFPSILSRQKYWSDLSNGMRLVLMRELTCHMTFEDAVLYLELQEKELEDFLNMCADEIKLREADDVRMERMQKRQMEMYDRGDWNADDGEWGRIFEEEMLPGGDWEVRVPANFFISREEVDIAKNFLGNYNVREHFAGEVTEENFDEINRFPTLAVMQDIVDRLDNYIGASPTFQELDFNEDFIDYLPEDILVIEEVQDGVVAERVVEIPNKSSPIPQQAAQNVRLPGAETPKTTKQPQKPMTKKSPKNTNRIGLEVPFIKTGKPGRPRKVDKIVHAPSRLREVTNAEDIKSPTHSPTLQAGREAVPTAAFASSASFTQQRRRSTSDTFTSVQNLGRNPFKEHSPGTPPPKHCASFRDDLPAQPAPSSPPKASTMSPPCLSGPRDASVQAPQHTPSAPKTQPSPKSQSTENAPSVSSGRPTARVQAISGLGASSTQYDFYPAQSLPAPKTTMNHGSSSIDEPFPMMMQSSTNNGQHTSPGLSKITSPFISTSGLDVLISTAYSALDVLPTSPPKPASSSDMQEPIAKFASNHSNQTTSAVGTQTAGVVPQTDQQSSYLSTDKNAIWHPAGPSQSRKFAPTKLKVSIKGAQTSLPDAKTSGPLSAASEASAAKRTRDVETAVTHSEEHIVKKPRLEQSDQTTQNLVGNIMESLHGLEEVNSLKRSTIAASPPTLVNHLSALHESDGGAVAQLDVPISVGSINRKDAVKISNQSETPFEDSSPIHKTPTQPRKTLGTKVEAAAQALPATEGPTQGSDLIKNSKTPMNPNKNPDSSALLPSQSRKTSGTDVEVAKAATQALPTSVSPTNRSDTTRNSKQPETPNKNYVSAPKPPAQLRKISGSKTEGVKTAVQALLQEFPAEAIDDPKRLEAPPPIIQSEIPSATRHARTSRHSSTESISNKRVKTSTPERGAELFYTPGKLSIEDVSKHGAETSPPEVFYTPSKTSTKGDNNNRAKTSTPEPAAEEFPTPSKVQVEVQIPALKRSTSELRPGTFQREGLHTNKSKNGRASSSIPAPTNRTILLNGVEVQIPAAKRASSELPAGSFEREGSPVKKLKNSGASSFIASPAERPMGASGATKVKPGSQKAPNGKTLKKDAPQAIPRTQAAPQNGQSSSTATGPVTSARVSKRGSTR